MLAAPWKPRGRLGRVMGASWDVLRASWERLESFGCLSGRLEGVLTTSWEHLGASWKHHVRSFLEACRLGRKGSLDV